MFLTYFLYLDLPAHFLFPYHQRCSFGCSHTHSGLHTPRVTYLPALYLQLAAVIPAIFISPVLVAFFVIFSHTYRYYFYSFAVPVVLTHTLYLGHVLPTLPVTHLRAPHSSYVPGFTYTTAAGTFRVDYTYYATAHAHFHCHHLPSTFCWRLVYLCLLFWFCLPLPPVFTMMPPFYLDGTAAHSISVYWVTTCHARMLLPHWVHRSTHARATTRTTAVRFLYRIFFAGSYHLCVRLRTAVHRCRCVLTRVTFTLRLPYITRCLPFSPLPVSTFRRTTTLLSAPPFPVCFCAHARGQDTVLPGLRLPARLLPACHGAAAACCYWICITVFHHLLCPFTLLLHTFSWFGSSHRPHHAALPRLLLCTIFSLHLPARSFSRFCHHHHMEASSYTLPLYHTPEPLQG